MQDTCCSDCNNLLKGEKVAEMDKKGDNCMVGIKL